MLLNHSTALDNGARILLRLPHTSDRGPLAELHERAGMVVDELELSRLLRVVPRERIAVCATSWVGGTHALVGFASGRPGAVEPEVLLVAAPFAEQLGGLLTAALQERDVRRPHIA